MQNKLNQWLLMAALIFTASIGAAHEGHCEDTDLGATMAEMKKPYKALRKAVKAGDEALFQQLAAELLEQSRTAREQRPLLVSEQQRKMAKYQQQMDKLIELLSALSQSKASDAPALIEQIQKLRKQGHKRFRKECD